MTHTSTDEKKNISSIMLFPCLGIEDELVRQFPEYGLINTYLYWKGREYDFNTMFLLFHPEEFTLGFHLFITKMEKNINFVETVDVPNGVILVYKVPARFGTDFLLFLNGAYSLTSPDFKGCFKLINYKMDANGVFIKTPLGAYETEKTMYHHIFNKTEYLRSKWREALGEDIKMPKDMELYEKCNVEKETLII